MIFFYPKTTQTVTIDRIVNAIIIFFHFINLLDLSTKKDAIARAFFS